MRSVVMHNCFGHFGGKQGCKLHKTEHLPRKLGHTHTHTKASTQKLRGVEGHEARPHYKTKKAIDWAPPDLSLPPCTLQIDNVSGKAPSLNKGSGRHTKYLPCLPSNSLG